MGQPEERLTSAVEVPVPLDEAFAWHERPGALERLTPPWQQIVIEQPATSLAVGATVVFRLKVAGRVPGPRWRARHVEYDPPRCWRDVQEEGPFASWEHVHRFEPRGADRSHLTDEVTYRLPLGAVGSTVAGHGVRSQLRRMFAYRHRTLVADVAAHARARRRATQPLHVAITGASGFIGTALAAFLSTGGHQVSRLVRGNPGGAGEIAWDPAAGTLDAAALRGVDAVVHLAGAPIGRRFTAAHKRSVMDSREKGTRLVAETLAGMDDGPRTLICASGIGYYGNQRGDEILTERSGSGNGFLAEVCRRWEEAADPARAAGIRVAHVRTGLVQSPAGGVLGLTLPLFRLGLGGRLGSGRQYQSWITLDDTIGIYHHILTTDGLEGPVNATAPEPVTNAEYTKTLGRVLGRPTVLPVPRFAPAVLLGAEGAEETAFASQRVMPERALETGYVFRHPDLETGLRHVLGRQP